VLGQELRLGFSVKVKVLVSDSVIVSVRSGLGLALGLS
jgi:hypothetical protein